MVTLLVGHRGVGKTQLLQRIRNYRSDAHCFDLDDHLSKKLHQPISEIFHQLGEEAFRQHEYESLHELVEANRNGPPCYIAVGAGYCKPLPTEVHVLWVRRQTDKLGRVFFDRPLLEPWLAPMDEWHSRFTQRQQRYHQWADEQLILREGLANSYEGERHFFCNTFTQLGGFLTLLPQTYACLDDLQMYVQQRLNWGVEGFELRSDLMSLDELKLVASVVPAKQLIIALREPLTEDMRQFIETTKPRWVDWDVELGECPWLDNVIYSLHRLQPGESVDVTLDWLQSHGRKNSHHKFAPLVTDLTTLEVGHAWATQAPRQRTFLPRSEDGRYAWYRQLMRRHYFLNFFREGDGSSIDQPTLLQWLAQPFAYPTEFAAVLGEPVQHSLSPTTHEKFFNDRQQPFFAISLDEPLWRQGAFAWLEKLGLRCAAITSPFKRSLLSIVEHLDEYARDLGAVNTILLRPDGAWSGANTDYFGLKESLNSHGLEETSEAPSVIWGGGGTLKMLTRLFPDASCYSARQGKPRHDHPEVDPELMIWAAGPCETDPPEHWQPKRIIDLSYQENSPARSYAKQKGADYISGQAMFAAQAMAQQDFWRSYERKPMG